MLPTIIRQRPCVYCTKYCPLSQRLLGTSIFSKSGGDSNDKPTAKRSRSMARSQCWATVLKRTGSLVHQMLTVPMFTSLQYIAQHCPRYLNHFHLLQCLSTRQWLVHEWLHNVSIFLQSENTQEGPYTPIHCCQNHQKTYLTHSLTNLCLLNTGLLTSFPLLHHSIVTPLSGSKVKMAVVAQLPSFSRVFFFIEH